MLMSNINLKGFIEKLRRDASYAMGVSSIATRHPYNNNLLIKLCAHPKCTNRVSKLSIDHTGSKRLSVCFGYAELYS